MGTLKIRFRVGLILFFLIFQDFVKGCIEDDLADHNLYARVRRFKMRVDNYLQNQGRCAGLVKITNDNFSRCTMTTTWPELPTATAIWRSQEMSSTGKSFFF